MRITRRVIINSIGFGMLGLIFAGWLASQILPTVFAKTYSIYGLFPEAGGVFTNQEVTYRGVQVGRVGRMSLTRNAVKIEMVIESGRKIPREGTRARIIFKSAVGEQFIDLLPERNEGPIFKEGDVIGLELTSIPVQTEDLLRELDAVLASIDPKALGTLIHELGQGLGGHGKDIRDLILALDTLSKIGAERRTEIAGAIRNAASVQDAFNSSREDFVRAASSLRTVAEVLAARREELKRTLRSAQTLDAEILKLLAARKAELNQIVADAGTVTRLTHAQLADLGQTLTYLGPFLSDVYKAYRAPYYLFNLVSNPAPPQCSYTPSSRPVRQVTDAAPKQPATDFKCPASFMPQLDAAGPASSIGGSNLPSYVRIQIQRYSWLRLFTLGYAELSARNRVMGDS